VIAPTTHSAQSCGSPRDCSNTGTRSAICPRSAVDDRAWDYRFCRSVGDAARGTCEILSDALVCFSLGPFKRAFGNAGHTRCLGTMIDDQKISLVILNALVGEFAANLT
jgi:hypothetical protein